MHNIISDWISAAIHLVTKVASWAWPIKLIVGAMLSIFAGGGALSFFLENATHVYAITYGFRPPVEGLPYLRTLVSSGSAILLVVAAVLAALFIGLLGGMGKSIASEDKRAFVPTDVSIWKALFISIGIALALASLLYAASEYRGPQEQGPYCSWPLLPCDQPNPSWFDFALSALLVMLPMALPIFRPQFTWIAASGAIFLYYFSIGQSILSPDGYGRLLRSTGFGGGIRITVELQSSDSSCKSEVIETSLLLRTNDYLVTFDDGIEKIREIPTRCVFSISHGVGGLASLEYKLPPRMALIDRPRWAPNHAVQGTLRDKAAQRP